MIGNLKYGICGAPISTLISYAAALIFSLLYSYIKKGLSLPVFKTIGFPLVNSFISIFGIYPLYLYMSRKWNSPFSFIISVLITIIIYILLNVFNGNLDALKSVRKNKAHIAS